MSKSPFVFIVVIGLFGKLVLAQELAGESSFISKSKEAAVRDQLKIKFGAIFQSAPDGSLGLNNNDQNNFKMAIDGVQKNPFGVDSSSKLSFRLQSLNSKGDLLMAIPEAYIEFKGPLEPSIEVTIGRKNISYSDVDQRLEMGIINPLLTDDQIRIEQQGLMGLHMKKQFGGFSLGFSALGLYLPHQGPGVREENGRLIAANRWAATPPQKLRFNNELKDITYKITTIDYAKIVNHQGYMAGLSWQFEQSAVKASFGRLPMNDLVISREIFADLDVRPQVNLTPVVTDQDVVTADFSFETGTLLTSVGLIRSQPANKAAEAQYETQKISASTTYAISVEYPLHDNTGFLKSVSLSAAETRGGDIEDLDSQGEKSDFVLTPQRFKFNKPVQFKSQLALFESRRQKIFADVKLIYDREQKGSVLDTEVSYLTALPGFTVNTGVTLVGVSEDNVDDKRFLFQYQVNDRIYGGLSYEF